ncbi:MAG: triose-phosphate isomerase [Candidatus Nealsonbacteria bacterium]
MKSLIVANWKMNPATSGEAKILFDQVKDTGAIICPPFIYLKELSSFRRSLAPLGAQDCFWENPPTGGGPFTGEVSALMLKNMGVEYVILGHSERRKYQNESNEMIAKKLKAVLTAGLKPILCVDKLSQLPKSALPGLIVAYEPLFAVGTGKPCSLERAEKMRLAIERAIGTKTPVLYGGSVNSQNAGDYICKSGFQGLLVGGASLNPKEFIDIVKNSCYC